MGLFKKEDDDKLLYEDGGGIRIEGLYVEVSDTISFSDTPSLLSDETPLPSVSDTITLSETAAGNIPITQSISDTASLSESYDIKFDDIEISVSDSVNFNENLAPTRPIVDISFIGEEHYSSASASSIVISTPLGTSENDLMLAVIVVEDPTDRITSVPSGWVKLSDSVIGTQIHRQYIYYKLATSSDISGRLSKEDDDNLLLETDDGLLVESSSHTWGLNALDEVAGSIVVFRNVSIGDPIGNNSISTADTSTTAAVAPTITVGQAYNWVLAIASNMSGATWTPPSGYTERADVRSGTGTSNLSLSISTKKYTTTGATGNQTVTSSVADYYKAALVEIITNDSPSGETVGVSDGLTLSESINLIKSLAVSVTDTVSFGESLGDTFPLGDVQATDTITVAELVYRILQILVSVNDSVSMTDSSEASNPAIYTPTVSDSVSLTESLNIVNDINISLSDTIGVSETMLIVDDLGDYLQREEGGGQDYVLYEDGDFIEITELGIEPEAGDTISLSESLQTNLEINVSATDTLPLTDTPALSMDINVEVSESVSLAENANAQTEFPYLNEGVSLSDSLTILKDITPSITDEINLSDLITATYNLTRSLTEPLSLEDIVTIVKGITVSAVDTISLQEAIQNLKDGSISVADTLSFNEVLSFIKDQAFNVTDAVALGESVIALKDIAATATETISLTDTVVTVPSGFSKTAADTLAFLETVRIGMQDVEKIMTMSFTAKQPSITATAKQPSITFDLVG